MNPHKLLLALVLICAGGSAHAACTLPYTFLPHTVIEAAKVMGNYNALKTCVDTVTAAEPVNVGQYGAVCDGITNDITALTAALAAGVPLTGAGKTCAVSGNLTLPLDPNFSNVEIKQLAAGTTTRTITSTVAGSNIKLTNFKVNMNASNMSGGSDAAGIWISTAASVLLDGVEAYGGGKGTGIAIIDSTDVDVRNPYVHDLQWKAAVDPGIEQIVALWFIRDSGVRVLNPRVADITGIIGAGSAAPYQTDGMDFSGSSHVTVLGGTIENVGEGTDTFSSDAGSDLWLYGTAYNNVAVGLKMGSIIDSGGVGVRCKDASLWCFVSGSNTTTPIGFQPQHIRCFDCQAINTGSAKTQANPTAFYLSWDGTNTAPTDILCVNCTAVDTSNSMVYGFRADVGVSFGLISPTVLGGVALLGDFHDQGSDITLAAGVPSPFQYSAPLTGGTVTMTTPMTTPVEGYLIDPAGTLAALTVTLPACRSDQLLLTEASFQTTAILTALTVGVPDGSALTGPPTTAAANDSFTFKCRAHHWYRKGPMSGRFAGYAIGSLPAGVVGMVAYITDQAAACPAKGVAPTAGGAINCPVFYNGAAWVGM